MTSILWVLIAAQIAMGGFDTLFHHEGTERLAWRPGAQRELRLHGVRNLVYAVLFALLGWTEPGGALAWMVLMLLGIELFITLWDFVEEDRSPPAAGERARDPHPAGPELWRDPGAAGASPARLGRAGRPNWRRPITAGGARSAPWPPPEPCCSGFATSPRRSRLQAPQARRSGAAGGGAAARAVGPGHRRHRLCRPAAGRGARRRRSRGDCADPPPRPCRRAAGTGPDRHLARPDRRAARGSTPSSTWPASRSATRPGRKRSGAGSSNPAWP